jgi:DinB superfamily
LLLGLSSTHYNQRALRRSVMQALSPAAISAPISLLEKTPGLLELLLRDVPKETMEWKPAQDRWSIAQVLAHLVVIEQLYNGRARRIIMENDPLLPKSVSSPEGEKQKSAREYLEEFVALRRAFVVFLHSIPSAAAGRGLSTRNLARSPYPNCFMN